ncbi:MAG: hypothetical protein LBU32_17695 [Clostridiales bacterium]|jgi:hypothetical protein|nr:hypothetical protein [Clostridiales bacterium]
MSFEALSVFYTYQLGFLALDLHLRLPSVELADSLLSLDCNASRHPTGAVATQYSTQALSHKTMLQTTSFYLRSVEDYAGRSADLTLTGWSFGIAEPARPYSLEDTLKLSI